MACRNGRDCIKFLVYFLNICLFILGIIIAGVAGYTAFNKSSALHRAIVAANITGSMTGLYIMFAGGLVIAVIAILACMATSSENKLLLWLSFFLILMLLIMQLVGVILCFYKYKKLEKNIIELVKDSAVLAQLPSNSATSIAGVLRAMIGQLETKQKCCGFNGPSDYGGLIPMSCRPHPKPKTSSSSKGDAELADKVAGLEDSETEYEPKVLQEDDLDSAGSPLSSNGATAASPVLKSVTISTTTTTSPTIPAATTSTMKSEATEPSPTLPSPSTTAAATAAVTFKSTNTTVAQIKPEVTTAAAETTTKLETTTAKPIVLLPPYRTGCFQRYKPIIYAAGGIGISVLISEFVLLICIGLLLCEVGKDYEFLA